MGSPWKTMLSVRGQKMSNRRPQTSGARAEAEMKDKASRAMANAKDPVEKLRLFALSRGAKGIMGLGRMFRRMDDDGSKNLNFEEFYKGIVETGLKCSEEECQKIMDKFDKDGNGTVNIDEFLIAIRPPISETRKNTILQAFKKLDKTGDELLAKFLQNFESSGIENAEKQGEGYGDGKVTKDEFIDYYSAISASIDNDAYFCLMMKSAYKI